MVKNATTYAEARPAKASTNLGRPRPSRAKGYAKLFKALGDETRLQILEMLSFHKSPLCACDIEARFALKQPTISHHLRLLREANLIKGECRGNWIYYSLVAEKLRQLDDFCVLLKP
jgi:ArsR family transcriptional regulator